MKKKILIIFFIAVSLRLIFFLIEAPWNIYILENKIIKMGTDQRGYHQLAINLMEHHEFTFKAGLPPIALRTPGYPLFIAIIYKIFGLHPWIVIVVQILLDSLTALIIFFSIRNLLNDKIGFIGALIYAVDPHLILHSNSYYSETLFLFFLALFLFHIILFYNSSNHKIKEIIYSGVFLGLATLVKPASAYLPLILSIFLLLSLRKKFWERLRYSILILLAYLLIISPWLIRNQITYGSLFLSNSGEYNLLAINITPMEIPKRKLPQHVVEYQLRAEADSLMLAEGKVPFYNNKPNDYWEELTIQIDYNKTEYWKRIAIKYIKKEPLEFLKFYVIGITHSLFNLGSKEFAYYLNFTQEPSSLNIKTEQNLFNLFKKFFSEKPLSEIFLGMIIFIYLLITYLCGIIGLAKTKEMENKTIPILLIIITTYFLLIAGAGGLARFKLPAIPFYVAFIGIGINELIIWIGKNSTSKRNDNLSK